MALHGSQAHSRHELLAALFPTRPSPDTQSTCHPWRDPAGRAPGAFLIAVPAAGHWSQAAGWRWGGGRERSPGPGAGAAPPRWCCGCRCALHQPPRRRPRPTDCLQVILGTLLGALVGRTILPQQGRLTSSIRAQVGDYETKAEPNTAQPCS